MNHKMANMVILDTFTPLFNIKLVSISGDEAWIVNLNHI